MLPDTIDIVFDRQPPSAKRLGIIVTTGRNYTATVANKELGLYALIDDKGKPFNVSTWGRSYTNNGYWHIDDETYRSLTIDN